MLVSAVVVFDGECTVEVPRQVRRALADLRGEVGIPDKVIDDLVLVATELPYQRCAGRQPAGER